MAYLDGSTLEFSLQCVGQRDIDLGSVESTVSLVQLPCTRSDLVQHVLQLRLGLVPDGQISNELVGVSSGKSDLELHAEFTVDSVHKVEDAGDLALDLQGRS